MSIKIRSPFVNVKPYMQPDDGQTPYAKTRQETNKPYTKIYLIRHCHPNSEFKEEIGDANIPLSDLGKEQRKLLNKKLEQINLDKIYSSELVRARETAELFAKKNKKRIFIDKRLNEIDWIEWYKIKYFRMSERTRIKRIKEYKTMDKNLHKLHIKSRRFLSSIYRDDKGKSVGLFCHGNIIRSMITSILNTDIIGFLSLEIYQSSITKLVIDKNGYIKINYINNICHLPHKPDENIFLASINQ